MRKCLKTVRKKQWEKSVSLMDAFVTGPQPMGLDDGLFITVGLMAFDIWVTCSFVMITFFYHGSSWGKAIEVSLAGKYCGDGYNTGHVVFETSEFSWKEWVLVAGWLI